MFSLFKFLLILIVLGRPVFAEDAVYTFVNKLYKPHEEIFINFENIKCSVSLRVSVFEASGKVEIYNAHTQMWLKVPTDWIPFDSIGPRLKLRLINPNSPNLSLDIKLQNIHTGEVFVAAPIKIWISDFQDVYISQLNKNIFDYDDKIHE